MGGSGDKVGEGLILAKCGWSWGDLAREEGNADGGFGGILPYSTRVDGTKYTVRSRTGTKTEVPLWR